MEGIAIRIKELIENQGLSNTDFANETDISPAIISHILSGRNKPSLQVINQIKARFTNVNLDYLITGSGSLYTDLTNVKTENSPPPSLAGQVSAFPMEGVRVVSEPGTKPQRAVDEEPTTTPPTLVDDPHSPDVIDSKPSEKTAVENKEEKSIEQIVIFYTDGSFKAYRS